MRKTALFAVCVAAGFMLLGGDGRAFSAGKGKERPSPRPAPRQPKKTQPLPGWKRANNPSLTNRDRGILQTWEQNVENSPPPSPNTVINAGAVVVGVAATIASGGDIDAGIAAGETFQGIGSSAVNALGANNPQPPIVVPPILQKPLNTNNSGMNGQPLGTSQAGTPTKTNATQAQTGGTTSSTSSGSIQTDTAVQTAPVNASGASGTSSGGNSSNSQQASSSGAGNQGTSSSSNTQRGSSSSAGGQGAGSSSNSQRVGAGSNGGVPRTSRVGTADGPGADTGVADSGAAGTAATFGMVIRELSAGTARTQGMKVGDIIMAVNGNATPDFDALRTALKASGAQAEVDFINVDNSTLERITLGLASRVGAKVERVRVD